MKNMSKFKSKYEESIRTFLRSVFAFLLALLVGAIFIEMSGYSAIETYMAIFEGSIGSSKGRVLALSQATPLLLTGMAFAIAYKVKLINVGAEGQLYTGAIASAIIGAYLLNLSPILHTSIAVLGGMIGGGLIGLLMGYLKIKFGANEIIIGIMLNEVLILIATWLGAGPLKADGSSVIQTERILGSAELSKLVPRSQLTTAFIIAVVLAVVLEFVMRKTVFGYETQVVGKNLDAAKNAGINVSRIYLITIFISGALAGLAGSALTLGVHYRFIENISAGLGFAGISVAALAAYNPIGAILSAVLFGVLKAGAMTLNRTTLIPVEFISVIQATVVVFVAAPALMDSITELFRKGTNKIKDRKEIITDK